MDVSIFEINSRLRISLKTASPVPSRGYRGQWTLTQKGEMGWNLNSIGGPFCGWIYAVTHQRMCSGLNVSRIDPHVPSFSFFFKAALRAHFCAFAPHWQLVTGSQKPGPDSRKLKQKFLQVRRAATVAGDSGESRGLIGRSTGPSSHKTMESIAQVNRPKLRVKTVAERFGSGICLHHVLSFPTRKCWLQDSHWIWVLWKNLWHLSACWNGYVWLKPFFFYL